MFKLLGNTHLPHRKQTANIKPVRMTPPSEVLFPTSQHIGAPATPVVSVGDCVKVGQLIAEASGPVSSPIYSSVSGKVKAIETYLKSDGRQVPAIRIESDGEMAIYEGIEPPVLTDVTSFLDAIKASGIVGLGGAGFPAAVKMSAAPKGIVNTIILNGAECEPYITSDTRTMLDDSEAIAEGIALLKKFVPSVNKFIIGIEKNKASCIKEMNRVFKDDASVIVKKLPLLYPQGAEKVLIHNTTGIVVPEDKLPADVGVLVINVTTLASLAKYVKTGMPLIEKCVTVDGSAINEPKNVIAPIGASIRDVIDFAGGLKDDAVKIIFGGPMTGSAAYSLDEPIVKTTNAIVALSAKDTIMNDATACIHCGKCVESCPHLLEPTSFTKAMDITDPEERFEKLRALKINLCVECGCCSYVCPANRPLVETNRIAKTFVREQLAHKANLKQ